MDYLKQVTKYLDAEGAEYEVLHHAPAYTAQEIAEAQHIPGQMMVKSVILKGERGYIMVVLPSIQKVDFDQLEACCGAGEWHLATEEELAEIFPECELGAEPPFGKLHDLPVYADQSLEADREIVFNAGTHTDTIKMRFSDWQRLCHPKMVKLGVHV